MLQKLVPESVLFVFTMGYAFGFWQLVKCEKYWNRILHQSELLRTLIRHLGPRWIVVEGENISPQPKSRRSDIVHRLDTRASAILILENSCLGLALIVSCVSYSLDPHFLVVNLVAFWSISRIKPMVKLKNEVLADVQLLLLFVYKWNFEDPDGCCKVVSTKIPALKIALSVVQNLN